MNKKKIGIAIILVLVVFLASGLGLILYHQSFSGDYVPTDDEIALYIQLDTKEDIGLLVFDYSADGSRQSGGMCNADQSLLRHDERLINVWNKELLQCSADTVELCIQFRIITEYTDPNYENIYPADITRYIDAPLSWSARFGESYFITITGDQTNGYQAVLTMPENAAVFH